MQPKHFLISAIVGLVAFVGGFLLANNLNRSETERLRSELEAAKSSANSDSQSDASLSDDEINAKIAEAEDNAQNVQFQKGLGIALYRYGAMKQDASVIERSIPILERANRLDPKDADVLTALGNAHFDVGYYKKDNDAFVRSRTFYESASKIRPEDVELIADIGLTYYLQQPPDLERAAAEFARSLSKDRKHEKSLQFYIQTLVKQNKHEQASEQLAKLREVNPQNSSIGELAALINNAPAR
jgi:tetratricopeptide (TPR) repeat protein